MSSLPKDIFDLYLLRNKVNNKYYVGITSRGTKTRLRVHRNKAKQDSKSAIHNAIRKYGFSSFEIIVLDSSAKSWQELCEKEISCIKKYDSYHNGYNCTLGGEGSYGRKHTDEAKRKIGKFWKGRKKSKHTEETRRKMSLVKQGTKQSDECKQKISKALKGRKHAREVVQARIGRKHTKEARKTMAVARSDKAKYYFINHKLGVSEYCTRLELCNRYGLCSNDTYHIVSGKRKSAKGWGMVVNG